MEIDRASTEFLYFGVTGDQPDTAEVAFMAAGARPTSTDWHSAIIVGDSTHALWADAQASGVAGDYYLARLVGPYNNTLVLDPDDYQPWGQLTGPIERPVRIFPVAVTVL